MHPTCFSKSILAQWQRHRYQHVKCNSFFLSPRGDFRPPFSLFRSDLNIIKTASLLFYNMQSVVVWCYSMGRGVSCSSNHHIYWNRCLYITLIDHIVGSLNRFFLGFFVSLPIYLPLRLHCLFIGYSWSISNSRFSLISIFLVGFYIGMIIVSRNPNSVDLLFINF